ncbi:MAG: DUF4093 domain-containing protein [Clostridia bacterium]|nr:DUF4093 domain-containing protein [Clostridia bacterium]
MIKISKPIIVEGKYDKIKIQSIAEALVISTDGFGVFSKKDTADMIRKIALRDGVILLTDSDGGGLVIRNYLKNILKGAEVINVYIPQIPGKEKRKKKMSKEGYLGVEGVEKEVLIKALEPYADGCEVKHLMSLTKADFYALGLSGKDDSAILREKLAKKLGLPDNLSSTALMEAINITTSEEEFIDALKEVKDNHGKED